MNFNINDYIVIITGHTSAFLRNHIYKQRTVNYYLQVEKDCENQENGSSIYQFKNKSNWRYATASEIAAYSLVNKPIDVTKMVIDNYSII